MWDYDVPSFKCLLVVQARQDKKLGMGYRCDGLFQAFPPKTIPLTDVYQSWHRDVFEGADLIGKITHCCQGGGLC